MRWRRMREDKKKPPPDGGGIRSKCDGISVAWSSDGQTLCAIGSKGWGPFSFIVHTYDVFSGTTLLSDTFHSSDKPHLSTYDESFRIMTTVRGRYWNDPIDINILEVGSTLTEIGSFVGVPPLETFNVIVRSFSPTTHCISISNHNSLRIIQKSRRLLDATAQPDSHSFSSDGSLFAASRENRVCVWTYSSGHFTLLREFWCQGPFNFLQFSPTSSSILGHSENTLQVWYLDEHATPPRNRGRWFVGLSRSGTRVTIACDLENTITVVDVLGKTPPQFIDVGTRIEGLAITGNVLLVQISWSVVAWLLTEEGLVDGAIGGRRVSRSDRIWTVPQSQPSYMFLVKDHVGVIQPQGGGYKHVYRTDTGEVLRPTQTSRHSDGSWGSLTEAHRGRDYLRYHSLSQRDTSPRDGWRFSRAALREGWIKDPKGKHRLWVPVEWRTDWDPKDSL